MSKHAIASFWLLFRDEEEERINALNRESFEEFFDSKVEEDLKTSNKPTMQFLNMIYKVERKVFVKYISDIGYHMPENLIEAPFFFDYDDGDNTYYAVTSNNFIVKKGEYSIYNYMSDYVTLSRSDSNKSKGIYVLKKYYSPYMFLPPSSDKTDETTISFKCHLIIPVLVQDNVTELFNEKEKILKYLKRKLKDKFTGILVGDFTISVGKIKMRLSRVDSGAMVIPRDKKTEVDELPSYVDVEISFRGVDEEMLKPGSAYMKSVGKKFKEKATK